MPRAKKCVNHTFYHGSPHNNLTELKEGAGGESQNVAGIYLTPDKKMALKYTKINGKTSMDRVYAVKVKLCNPADRKALKDIWAVGLTGHEKRNLLKSKGYDSLVDEYMDEVVLFSQKQIQSIKKLKSKNRK